MNLDASMIKIKTDSDKNNILYLSGITKKYVGTHTVEIKLKDDQGLSNYVEQIIQIDWAAKASSNTKKAP